MPYAFDGALIFQTRQLHSRFFFAAALAVAGLCMPTRAIAQVGKRDFISPLITEDANPSNDFDLEPEWYSTARGSTFSAGFSFEKLLSNNFSIDVSTAWDDLTCANACESRGRVHRGRSSHHHRNKDRTHPVASLPTSTSKSSDQSITKKIFPGGAQGWDDLEVLFKYAFFGSDEHETRLGIGLDMFLPCGSPQAGAGTHTYLGPMLMLAKGLGDLPSFGLLKYLRPLAAEADVEYLWKASGSMADDLMADWIVEYSMPYLSSYVQDFHLPVFLNRLVPFSEFTYEQIVRAPRGGTQPDLRILPGVAYVTEDFQFSIASSFAMNEATIPLNHAGVFALIDFTPEKYIPGLKWKPFSF
jgi:hypothetical protein